MLKIQLDVEFFEWLRNINAVIGGTAGISVGKAVQRFLHLSLDQHLIDLRQQLINTLGYAAFAADQALCASLQHSKPVLADGKGLQLAAVKYRPVQAFIHAEQAVLVIEHHLGAEEAEVNGLRDHELLLERLILRTEVPILQELVHCKITAVLYINHTVAVVTNIVPLYLPRQQSLYLSAADGAGLSFAQ